MSFPKVCQPNSVPAAHPTITGGLIDSTNVADPAALNGTNIADQIRSNVVAARDAVIAALPDPNATTHINSTAVGTQTAQTFVAGPANSNGRYVNVGTNIEPTSGTHTDFTSRMREFIQTADGSTFSKLDSNAKQLLLLAFNACVPGSNTSVLNTLTIDQKKIG